jgi:hypothetical protein
MRVQQAVMTICEREKENKHRKVKKLGKWRLTLIFAFRKCYCSVVVAFCRRQLTKPLLVSSCPAVDALDYLSFYLKSLKNVY